MRLKNFLTIVGLFACMFAFGYGAGKLFSGLMNKNKAESGYTGPSEIKIEDGKMTPEALLSLGRLSDPQLSPDGKTILYGVSYTNIAANNSCRNLFLCNVDGSEKVQLTHFAKSVSNARWNEDGSAVYFLQGGQLYRAPLKGKKLGKREKLSEVPAGISEFKLSPDFANIMYISTIKNPNVIQPLDTDPSLDKAQAYTTEDLMYRHWDHWVTELPHTFVSTLNNGVITPDSSFDILGGAPYELPTEPFGGAEQLDWNPDGRHIAYSCRKLYGKKYAFSTNTEIYIYDILTGSEIVIPMGGGYDTDPVWSPDGRHLAWISMARDGYEADAQRIMVVDVDYPEAPEDGQSFGLTISEARQLAADLDRDASGLVWTADSRGLYFNALTDGLQALYKVGVEEGAQAQRLTPDDWHYDFFSPFGVAEDGTLLASYYSLNFPTELVSINVSEPSFRQISRENEHILSQLQDITTESIWIETVDHQQMQCWMMYPPQFDPSSKYPAIEIALGGPQGTNSQDWSYRWCYRLMAQNGYVVIMPNRRGTTAFGQEWKEQISGDYSGLNMQDYLAAGRYMRTLPYVDKLACVGASYGGYSVYMLEGLHGDLYDCFVAHAGIFDEKYLYNTTEEMWFANWDNGGLHEIEFDPAVQTADCPIGPAGDGVTFGGIKQGGSPWSNLQKPMHHYANSPSEMVTKWHTPILCIHGGMDFRIPYDQGMAAFNTAQMMGVPSKLAIFPDECHWILQPQNALFWHRTFFDWLDRWMK